MERAEVKVVVNKLVETVEAEYSAESAARLVLARIIAKIEVRSKLPQKTGTIYKEERQVWEI